MKNIGKTITDFKEPCSILCKKSVVKDYLTTEKKTRNNEYFKRKDRKNIKKNTSYGNKSLFKTLP